MQTYLCVVHPIYQKDEQALQTQTKKERGEKEEDKVVTVVFSFILFLLNTLKKSKKLIDEYREGEML